MKMINSNNWAPLTTLGVPIPITDPPIANGDTLYYSFYVYNAGMFYYILTLFAKDNFYEDN